MNREMRGGLKFLSARRECDMALQVGHITCGLHAGEQHVNITFCSIDVWLKVQ